MMETKMGYMDDFYTKENIFGYTGDLRKLPTVYFADAGGINPTTVKVQGKDYVVVKFGHITQQHDDPRNVGRGKVWSSRSYAINNVKDGDTVRAQESLYGPDHNPQLHDYIAFHDSRNPFIPVSKDSRDVLAAAITKFKDQKTYPEPDIIARDVP